MTKEEYICKSKEYKRLYQKWHEAYNQRISELNKNDLYMTDDELRAVHDEWYVLYSELMRDPKIDQTCAYCGETMDEPTEPGDPTDEMRGHIWSCEKHPVVKAKAHIIDLLHQLSLFMDPENLDMTRVEKDTRNVMNEARRFIDG